MNRAIKFSFKPSNANLLCVGGHKTQSYDQMSLLLLQVGMLNCCQGETVEGINEIERGLSGTEEG